VPDIAFFCRCVSACGVLRRRRRRLLLLLRLYLSTTTTTTTTTTSFSSLSSFCLSLSLLCFSLFSLFSLSRSLSFARALSWSPSDRRDGGHGLSQDAAPLEMCRSTDGVRAYLHSSMELMHSRCTLSVQQACCTKRDPLRDEIREVGRGLLLADTQTGRYVRLYSRRRSSARRGADARALPQILPWFPSCDFGKSKSFQNAILLITKSLIPIPVPGQYRLSCCLE
jgi:hypothetical protein